VNDPDFIRHLNDLSRRNELVLPIVAEGESPPAAFLEDWARFLEACVKRGIKLSDPRWQRLAVASNSPSTRFTLEGDSERSDADFRIGLQLLVGMLGLDEED
jgi:hypothetical protein